MAVVELVDGAEVVVTAEGMSVYCGVDGVLRAVFRTDEHGDPLTVLCFVDMTECVAVAEVVDVERLLSA